MGPRDEGLLLHARTASRSGGGNAATGRLLAPVRSLDRWLARKLVEGQGRPPIGIVLWNGEEVGASRGPLVARVLIRDRKTLLGLMHHAELRFGDAYSEGRIDVEGDLVLLLKTLFRAGKASWRSRRPSRRRWERRSSGNTLRGSRRNIHHHYDLGNEFYRLWLDRERVYTCAYFPTPATPLEEAQRAKMEHVCRKLQLRSGERVVEAGAGWGSLALHMAKHHGVYVTAYNIAREQVLYARERARREGLSDRVEFVDEDYRAVSGKFDAFVSVGMLEHVGKDHYHDLGDAIDRCLRESGRGLIHSIGRARPGPISAWIEKRIFPGSYPPTLREMMDVLEPWNLAVLDVENLRLHYAKTLEHWLERFEKASEQVVAMFDQRFLRAWRLYLAGSIAAFDTSTLQLFQVVFSRAANNDIPWTRAHLYAPV
jgi:cyclopropane-fatty-acyl-phospholipid synthase